MVSALRTLAPSATRTHLRDICLHFSLWDAAHWALIIELGRIDAELAGDVQAPGRYKALRTVAFQVRAEPRFRIRDFVLAHFPLLRRRVDVVVQQVW
ncbi:hypothetical protein EXIGLDRAFT_58666 [Exidia glandulosa HHB12029]|uniref:Uncharacterized protein n=1 Tax=Exidia glandulosa HHB12029 TaxID=1314781 RepID=A0A166MMG5_EXIGL|nr:hypothetical protein EXIGLDRAFT_58666 [Exidia glandulosa HHB12029]